MKIHHLRNATFILHLGKHQLLVDPMLGEVGSISSLKPFGRNKKRNPLVPLPSGASGAVRRATGCLITHCQRKHLDHLDKAGMALLKEMELPVWAAFRDVPWLKEHGLQAHELKNGDLGLKVIALPAKHGRGLAGAAMGPGTGWFLQYPDEPSIYITGDTVLTPQISDAVKELKPDLIVAPAGNANLGAGSDILFTVEELVHLAHMSGAFMIFNHMEALDHCPVTRESLQKVLDEYEIAENCWIPKDGEIKEFLQP